MPAERASKSARRDEVRWVHFGPGDDGVSMETNSNGCVRKRLLTVFFARNHYERMNEIKSVM